MLRYTKRLAYWYKVCETPAPVGKAGFMPCRLSLSGKEAHSEKEHRTYSKTYEAKVSFERNIKTRDLSQQAYYPTTY